VCSASSALVGEGLCEETAISRGSTSRVGRLLQSSKHGQRLQRWTKGEEKRLNQPCRKQREERGKEKGLNYFLLMWGVYELNWRVKLRSGNADAESFLARWDIQVESHSFHVLTHSSHY
jgi:hypothetical protein